MKTFALKLKLKSGLLTELQSDTIYGHFCWRLKEKFDEPILSNFLDLYKNKKPVFLLSNGLLVVDNEIHFPRPYIFNKPHIQIDKYERVKSFVQYKSNKEKNYLTLNELKDFLNTGKINFNEEEVISNNSSKKNSINLKKGKAILEESLRVSVQIDRNTLGSAEHKLFSYNPKYARKDVSFVILVKVLDEENYKKFNGEDILRDVFEIGFGKKKSSGYGQFGEISFSEFNELVEPSEYNSFIVFGNYLPDSDDGVTPIGYEINTKYGKFGEELAQSENPFKKPVVFLSEGSCFRTTTKKDYYGRVTNPKEISEVNSFAIQFGMPFILNFNLT